MQLQISYDAAEDRLLLSLALDDRSVAFWLTRRLTGLLWQVLWARAASSVDAAATDTAKQWLLRLKEDRARQRQVLTEEPRLQSALPPLLVTTLQYGPAETGGHVLSLIDAAGHGEQLNVDDDSLYGLIRLLDETLATSDWRLDLWRPEVVASEEVSPARLLH